MSVTPRHVSEIVYVPTQLPQALREVATVIATMDQNLSLWGQSDTEVIWKIRQSNMAIRLATYSYYGSGYLRFAYGYVDANNQYVGLIDRSTVPIASGTIVVACDAIGDHASYFSLRERSSTSDTSFCMYLIATDSTGADRVFVTSSFGDIINGNTSIYHYDPATSTIQTLTFYTAPIKLTYSASPYPYVLAPMAFAVYGNVVAYNLRYDGYRLYYLVGPNGAYKAEPGEVITVNGVSITAVNGMVIVPRLP